MAGFLVKIIVCPLIIYISGLFFRQVSFTALYQPVIIGLILAVAAHTMELYILKPGTLWISSAIDFVAATLIIYVVPFFMKGLRLSFGGAISTALLFTITEIFQHSWLINSNKTVKGPQDEL
ncbi:MAG: Membrane spanning protein [Desulfotomaculum sp. 46_296]|nr:MAG: Membrane spanning protein [Desulfotomaculum sp. 46_296]HAU31782.1 hypothetical protein [Desulfotomaculum sp.]